MSMRTLLVWGLLAGLAAGIIAFGFAVAFGEPPVEVAISLEEAGHEEHSAEEPIVTRGVQRTFGLAIATCAFGAALGGLFSLAFAFAYGRIGTPTPRSTSLAVAVIGFVAVALVPYLTYPPNPPAVGHEETIEERTVAFFGMMVISVVVAILACWLARRIGGWLGVVGAGLAYVAAVSVAAALLPQFNEVPEGFPAQTLWEFRLASLGTQAVLWATIGVAFTVLVDRAQRATNRAIDSGLAAG